MDLRETRARKRLDLLGYRHEEYDSNTPLEALESFLYKLDESVRENPSDVGKPYGPVARLECLHRMAEAGISTTAIIVWNTIAGYTNSKQQDGICFPGIDTIARGSGQSPATVKRCIKMLVDLNVLEKLSIGRGRGVSNKYRVVPDWRPTLGLSLNLEKKSGENTSSYDKQLNDEPISPKGKQHPNDPLISKKGSCEPEKQLKVEQKTAQTRATNSLSNPGLNPGKIERQADTSGLPVARAPSGRCSPPGEQRLDELIARLSEGMKDQQKKAIDKYRKRNIQNGHSHAAMTDGIERNLAYAKAWGKEPWNLVAMIRDQKYFDPWDTRPPKKKQKKQKTKAKKYGNERNTRARTTAAAKPNNKDRDLRKPITTNRQPPEPTPIAKVDPTPIPPAPKIKFTRHNVASFDADRCRDEFIEHVRSCVCETCTKGVADVQKDIHTDWPDRVAEYLRPAVEQSKRDWRAGDVRRLLCNPSWWLLERLEEISRPEMITK